MRWDCLCTRVVACWLDGATNSGSLKNSCGPPSPVPRLLGRRCLRLSWICRVNALKRNESGTCDWIVFILMRFTVSFRIRYSGDPSLSATLTPTSLGQPSGDADQFEQCALLTPNFQLQWQGKCRKRAGRRFAGSKTTSIIFRQTT